MLFLRDCSHCMIQLSTLYYNHKHDEYLSILRLIIIVIHSRAINKNKSVSSKHLTNIQTALNILYMENSKFTTVKRVKKKKSLL